MKEKFKIFFSNARDKLRIFFKKRFFRVVKEFVWSKFFLINLGLVMFVYLIIVFSTIKYLDSYTNHGEKIKVPNLVGKNSSEAKMILEDLGLSYEILDSIYDPNIPNGIVKQQMIEPTAVSKVYVKSDRVIGLRLSKNSEFTEMPNLVYKHINFAKGIVERRGLKLEAIEFTPTKEANGSVLEQKYKGKKIKEGTSIPIGSKIVLVVGKNEVGYLVELPNLVGLNYQEALHVLDSRGFLSISTTCQDCETREDSLSAVVYAQSPEFMPNKAVERSQTIGIIINAGASQIEDPIE